MSKISFNTHRKCFETLCDWNTSNEKLLTKNDESHLLIWLRGPQILSCAAAHGDHVSPATCHVSRVYITRTLGWHLPFTIDTRSNNLGNVSSSSDCQPGTKKPLYLPVDTSVNVAVSWCRCDCATTVSPAGLEVPPLGPKWDRWAKKLGCASDPPIPADCRLDFKASQQNCTLNLITRQDLTATCLAAYPHPRW